MDLIAQLVTYGGLGVLAAVLLFLLLDERKQHGITREKLNDSMAGRLEDSKNSVTKVTDAIGGLTTGIQAISEKIKVSRSAE